MADCLRYCIVTIFEGNSKLIPLMAASFTTWIMPGIFPQFVWNWTDMVQQCSVSSSEPKKHVTMFFSQLQVKQRVKKWARSNAINQQNEQISIYSETLTHPISLWERWSILMHLLFPGFTPDHVKIYKYFIPTRMNKNLLYEITNKGQKLSKRAFIYSHFFTFQRQ